MPNRRITIKGPKNYDIPARLYTPTPCRDPTHCVVLAHPYFHHNGSMDNPVVIRLACLLQSLGWVCLTFDFRGHRGAGAGRGASWRGHVERNDLQSCVDWLLHAHDTLTHVCLAGYSYGALVASSCLPHPIPDRRVECSWLFVSLPLDAYKYSLWMFPKPRRTCHVKYVEPSKERSYDSGRKSLQASFTAAFQQRGDHQQQQQQQVKSGGGGDMRKVQSVNDLHRHTTTNTTTTATRAGGQGKVKPEKPRVLSIWGERDEFAGGLTTTSTTTTTNNGNGNGTGGGNSRLARKAKRKQSDHGWECELMPDAGHWIDDADDAVLDAIEARVTDWVDRG